MQEVIRIPLEGVHNTRDLGGYRADGGRSIKPHSLIRSGELYTLTEKDKNLLINEYELKTVVDFRTEAERHEKPDPVMEGVRYIVNPILEETAIGITREKETDNNVASMVLSQMQGGDEAGIAYMEGLYAGLLNNDFCKKQYASFFHILLHQEQGAVLWHCTAGKDRAGLGAALLLSLLGVPREQVIVDYMKVNEFAAGEIDRMVQSVLETSGDLRLAEKVRILFSVQESYIRTVFRIIEESYGTVERYLTEELGLNKDTADTLKNKYLI